MYDINENISNNDEESYSDCDEESDHYCSEYDFEDKSSTKTITAVPNIYKNEEMNQNIKNKCNAWWTLPKCVTENNAINTLSENIRCYCESFARIYIVSKDGPNKGKQFLGCSNFDVATKKNKCKFFQWMEENKKENYNEENNEKILNDKSHAHFDNNKKEDNVNVDISNNDNGNDSKILVNTDPIKKQKLNSENGVKIIFKIIKHLNKEELGTIRKQITYCIHKQFKKDHIYDRNLLQTEMKNEIIQTFKCLQEIKREGFLNNKNIIQINNNEYYFHDIYQNEKHDNVTNNNYLDQLHRLYSIFHSSKINIKTMEVNINYARWGYVVFCYIITFNIILKMTDDNDVLTFEKTNILKKIRKKIYYNGLWIINGFTWKPMIKN